MSGKRKSRTKQCRFCDAEITKLEVGRTVLGKRVLMCPVCRGPH